MNSTIVAKNFENQLGHVMRDINELTIAPNLEGCSWFIKTEADIKVGRRATRKTPSFDMTGDGFTLLKMGWTGESALRLKIAPAANLNDPHTLFATFLGYTERVIELEGKNAEHLATDATAPDPIVSRSGAENITTVAKELRMRPGDQFAWLDEKVWIFRVGGGAPWRAYQAKIDAGYLTVRETPDRTRDDRTFMQVLVTPKRRARFAEMLTQGDLQRSDTKRTAA